MKAPRPFMRLGHRNVYILPTRAGAMLAVTLAVLLVGSINYQLGLGYLLAFLLAGAGLATLFQTHATLRGLTLSLRPPDIATDGLASSLTLRVQVPPGGSRLRAGIEVQAQLPGAAARRLFPLGAAAGVPVPELAAGGDIDVAVPVAPLPRGVHPLPALRVSTRFPLGLFRAWAVWRPTGELLVAPQPEAAAPPWPRGADAAGADNASAGSPAMTHAADDFEGLRPWRPGDSMRQIAWRKSAQTDNPVSRDAPRTHENRAPAWLDWDGAGPGPAHSRLRRLAAWVDAADRAGLRYGLRVPGHLVEPGRGPVQRRRCLEALARC